MISVMNRLSGFIVHSLLSSLSLSYCILPPSFLFLFYLSQPLTSPSVLDDIIWNGSPPDMVYDMAHLFIVLRQAGSPTLGTSHLSVLLYLGLFHISPLFLFWNLGQITSTFRLNVGTYPPCLRYPHHAYPSSRITWKYQITPDTPGPLARTTSIFVISPFHPLSFGSYWNYRC